jgi:hypothetical protein
VPFGRFPPPWSVEDPDQKILKVSRWYSDEDSASPVSFMTFAGGYRKGQGMEIRAVALLR